MRGGTEVSIENPLYARLVNNDADGLEGGNRNPVVVVLVVVLLLPGGGRK